MHGFAVDFQFEIFVYDNTGQSYIVLFQVKASKAAKDTVETTCTSHSQDIKTGEAVL